MKVVIFSFVDDILTGEFTKLEPMTRLTFVSYLEKLTPLVEQKISEDMPSKYGLVIDGWTDAGTSSHYIVVFAIYSGKSRLLTFSPLGDEEKYDTPTHVKFIQDTLMVFKKNVSSLTFQAERETL